MQNTKMHVPVDIANDGARLAPIKTRYYFSPMRSTEGCHVQTKM